MEKEYIVTVDGKPAGRVVGRERLGEIAPLVAEESEVFVVYDANAAEVAAEVIEAVPGVRGSIAIETSEEDKSMDTVLLIERSLLEAGASRKALVLASQVSPRPSTSAACGMPMSRPPCSPRSMRPWEARRGSISTITRICWA